MSRITAGALVRHRLTGRMGIVIEHTMWDEDSGAFRVKWNKVYAPGSTTFCTTFLDRADRWVLVNGCDIS